MMTLAIICGMLGFIAVNLFRVGMELCLTRKILERIAKVLERGE